MNLGLATHAAFSSVVWFYEWFAAICFLLGLALPPLSLSSPPWHAIDLTRVDLIVKKHFRIQVEKQARMRLYSSTVTTRKEDVAKVEEKQASFSKDLGRLCICNGPIEKIQIQIQGGHRITASLLQAQEYMSAGFILGDGRALLALDITSMNTRCVPLLYIANDALSCSD